MAPSHVNFAYLVVRKILRPKVEVQVFVYIMLGPYLGGPICGPIKGLKDKD